MTTKPAEPPATDLERLDGAHVAAWQQPRASLPPLTRVLSADRTHVWPGDPDDVGDWLAHNGFRFAFRDVEGRDGRGETLVLVLEGPTGKKL